MLLSTGSGLPDRSVLDVLVSREMPGAQDAAPGARRDVPPGAADPRAAGPTQQRGRSLCRRS